MKENAIIGGRKIMEYLAKGIRICFEYLIALFIVSPLLGSVLAYFDLPWRWRTVLPILAIGILIAYFIHKLSIFTIESWKELIIIIAIIGIGSGIYGQYSPVLEIRQDPALYMYRALNLVNYGYIYQSMNTYAEIEKLGVDNTAEDMDQEADFDILTDSKYGVIQNGTYYIDGKLYTDFYPGGTFFYAILGKIFKPFIFYGQTIIMLVVIWVLYFTIKAVAKQGSMITNAFCTLLFMISPMIVWFGRGSFTEPVALFFYLFIVLLLAKKSIIESGIILILALCASYTSRIDYLSLLLLGAFLIFYASIKLGIVYLLCVFFCMLLMEYTYPLYYQRNVLNDLPILEYGYILVGFSAILGWIFGAKIKNHFINLLYAKWVKKVVFLVGVLLALLMYLDNTVSDNNYSYALIHGQYLRTYSESIMDLLFLVFPNIVIICGFLSMYKFLDRKYNLALTLFLGGSVLAYSYLFFGASNSPQLYWMLRRYMNVLLPGMLLGFVVLLQNMEKRSGQIISLACGLLSANLFFNSNQIVNYEGLDKSVMEVEQQLREVGYNTVFYTSEVKTQISSLFSYSNLEFIPVSDDHKTAFFDYINEKDTERAILITEQDTSLDNWEEYELNYVTLGENYGRIPTDIYEHKVVLKGYSVEELKKYENVIFPGIFADKTFGIDDDGWTRAYSAYYTNFDTKGREELVVEMRDYYNYNIEEENLQIKVKINDEFIFEPTKMHDNKIHFDIDTLTEEITKIQIYCSTFNMEKLGIGTDSRNLGINIARIYCQ